LKYIDSSESLDEAVHTIRSSSWAAVDTEADSLHHYVEKLCLVQVSVPGEDFVIDPLHSLDLGPLVRVLNEKFLILHGADFDIRILKKNSGFNPRTLFDTMIAAQLLGYERQGLADLVLKHCGVALSKSSQKADWSLRPLQDKLLAYAANDTHYLEAVHQNLRSELSELGRLSWHEEACRKLLETLSAKKEPGDEEIPRWQIKGSKLLKDRALTCLKHLWEWREEEAKRRDKPSFKILNSEILIETAQWADKNPDLDVSLLPNAPRNVKGELRETLNRLTKEARHLPGAVYVEKKRSSGEKRKWSAKEDEKLAALKSERERLAKELKLHPSLLATNAVLEKLLQHPPKNETELAGMNCLMSWQVELVAEGFLKILNA